MGDDVLGTCDRPAIMYADSAVSSSVGSAPEPEREGDEAGMAPADAADNDSEESFTYGRRLRRARLAKQWSQLQLAYRIREVGAEHRGAATLHSLLIMISKWENDRKHPNQYSLHLIAAALEIDVASLGLPVDQDFVF
jgi:ribosome-binding protein aMBF1 (putative translation factor)